MASAYPYQDAYVFVASANETTWGALQGLWKDRTVRYVARLLSGAHGALVFLEATEDEGALWELREKIMAVRAVVNPTADVGIALAYGPKAPTRWSQKQPVGAYVRIRAANGLAGAVFEAVNRLPEPTYAGSALVIGDWDVLLELGAPTLEALKGVLLDQVNPIAGVLWTDTSIVINHVDEPLSPGEP